MIKYKKGYKYQLVSNHLCSVGIRLEKDIFLPPYIILRAQHISMTSVLAIRKGYAWNGASGPALDTKNTMRGSLVHDALYQLMREDKLDRKWRKQADKELEKICISAGMNKIVARIWYYTVRGFAGFAVTKESLRKILTAP